MSKDPINEVLRQVPRMRPVSNYNPYGGNRTVSSISSDINAGLNTAAVVGSLASRFMPRPNYATAQQSAPAAQDSSPAAPVAPKPAGGSNPYGFAASGSDQDTAANFFAADKRMQQAQAAPAPAPKSVAPSAPMPVPRPKESQDPDTAKMMQMYSAKPNDVPLEKSAAAMTKMYSDTPAVSSTKSEPTQASPPASQPAQGKEPESESGPTRGKKKMSESTLINAFLKLQATEHSNIFEAAKKAKKDWDGDGKVESGKAEYLGSKIAAAKKAGKMEEEVEQINEIGDTKSGQKLINMVHKRASDRLGKAVADKDPKNARKYQEVGQQAWDRMPSNKYDEEVNFSETELAHFEAVIARKDQKGKEKGIGDTVDSADLTDEYINEMAQRGVKAGTKRGSYKGKAHKGGADATSSSMPAEEPKGVPHVLDQIRHGQEDEHGFKSITHPASSPDAPVTKRIHRSELHGFYDRYHNTEKPAGKEKEYSSFLGKHFGDERTSSPTTKSVTTDLSKVEKANLKGGGAKPTLGGSKLVGGSK